MTINHNFFSRLAFNLAEINLGKTSRNPSVGCIVVKNGSVISSGLTSLNGRPHAEFNALKKKLNFKGADMYVTLEPCTHYGFTPPCTNIIKRKKIKNVFYNFNDPDLRTYNNAKNVLKNIRKLNKISSQFKNFYKSYYLNKKVEFPLIDGKIAISKDFYTISKKSKWITNSRSRQVGHLIRSKYDCIVSTSNSINKDNSLLNCRIKGLNYYKPDLIIIDRDLKLKKKHKLIKISNKRKTYIVTSSNNQRKISYFKRKKIKIIKINQLLNKYDFEKLFKKIFEIGKGRILIETGLKFLNKLLQFKLINNLYLFQSDKTLKQNGYNNCNKNLIKNFKLKKKILVNLKNDNLFKIQIK